METLFHTYASQTMSTQLAALEKATKYAVSKMEPMHLELWALKQMCLTDVIVGRTRACIDRLPNTPVTQRSELKALLDRLGHIAFPLFVAGMDANPVHHNFQAVENMLELLSRDGVSDYQLIKNAAILALLHDVGNGFVAPNLKKIKSSDIKDRRSELAAQGTPEQKIEEKVSELVDQARAFRKAHMEEGERIARDLLAELNRSEHVLTSDDIACIGCCIKHHDDPSIAELCSEIKRPYTKDDLIPLDNELACLLREADRLWMVSKEGLEKDLFDDLRKGKRPDACSKLWNNVTRFKDEYGLYARASFITDEQKSGFIHQTLFRSEGGFAFCKHQIRERLKECFGPAFIDG